MQHSYQSGWALDRERIYASLSSPPTSATYPHLALVNAMCLWGAHLAFVQDPSTMTAISAPPQMRSTIEQAYFSRVNAHLQNQADQRSLRQGLQIIQTEVMLATYLFLMGEIVGGAVLGIEYHVNAAVSLSKALKLYKVVPQAASTASIARAGSGTTPDVTEENERIALFWRVFCLDRQWAAAEGKPAQLRLEGDAGIAITTPWPVGPDEYSQVSDF